MTCFFTVMLEINAIQTVCHSDDCTAAGRLPAALTPKQASVRSAAQHRLTGQAVGLCARCFHAAE